MKFFLVILILSFNCLATDIKPLQEIKEKGSLTDELISLRCSSLYFAIGALFDQTSSNKNTDKHLRNQQKEISEICLKYSEMLILSVKIISPNVTDTYIQNTVKSLGFKYGKLMNESNENEGQYLSHPVVNNDINFCKDFVKNFTKTV